MAVQITLEDARPSGPNPAVRCAPDSSAVTSLAATYYVITVCDRARATCPVFPGSENTLHWGLDDPSEVDGSDEEKLAAFRQTQLEISTRLRPFIEVALRSAGRIRGATQH